MDSNFKNFKNGIYEKKLYKSADEENVNGW
jgi:hypothetical protein